MSEENTKSLNADSTAPLPFEEFVRQQLALLFKQQAESREEMVERFVQLSRQIQEGSLRTSAVEAGNARIEKKLNNLDFKLDMFIEEQIQMKREFHRFQESMAVNP